MSHDHIEKQMSNVHLTDPLTEEETRPASPGTDASADSFHSAGDEGDTDEGGSPQHRLGNSISDDPTSIIEPDGQEGPVIDSTPTDEANFINGIKPGNPTSSSLEDDDDEEEEEFLNEEHLKDLELSMSEEEKNEKREESRKHKEMGNTNFKAGDYVEAVSAYTTGLRICPVSFPKDRAILFSNRGAAKAKQNLKKEAIKDCSKAIDLDETYMRAICRRATLNEETEQLDEALQDFQRVLQLDPYNQEALQAVRRLPDMISERNEKMKDEMMGKLKDLGNMILRPFGLSTSNFEMKQDGSSGGYNISFKQNNNS